jgi:O-antigen ligase
LGFLGVGFAQFFPNVHSYLNTFLGFWKDRHFIERVDSWENIWYLIQRQPFLAYGVGSAGDALAYLFPTSGPSVHVVTHNLWLKFLIETGFPGAVLFAGLVLVPLAKALRWAWSSKTDYLTRCTLGLYAGVISAFLIQGVTGSAIEVFPVNVWFWLSVGVLARRVFGHPSR